MIFRLLPANIHNWDAFKMRRVEMKWIESREIIRDGGEIIKRRQKKFNSEINIQISTGKFFGKNFIDDYIRF